MGDFFANSYGCHGGTRPDEESDKLLVAICQEMLEGDNTSVDQQFEAEHMVHLGTNQKQCGIGKSWKLVQKYYKRKEKHGIHNVLLKFNKKDEEDYEEKFEAEHMVHLGTKQKQYGIGKSLKLVQKYYKRKEKPRIDNVLKFNKRDEEDYEEKAEVTPLSLHKKVDVNKSLKIGRENRYNIKKAVKLAALPLDKRVGISLKIERNGERDNNQKKIVAPKRKAQTMYLDHAPDFKVIVREQEQELNTKLEATTKKLKQDYQKTNNVVPTRRSIVLDTKDIAIQKQNKRASEVKKVKGKAKPKSKKWWSKPSTSTKTRLHPNIYRGTIL